MGFLLEISLARVDLRTLVSADPEKTLCRYSIRLPDIMYSPKRVRCPLWL